MKGFIERLRRDMTRGRRHFFAIVLSALVCFMPALFYIVPEESALVRKLPTEASAEKPAGTSSTLQPLLKKGKALRSPFGDSHAERDGMRERQAAAAGKTSSPARRIPVRLVGTAMSKSGMRAILSRGEEQWSMAPGDRRGDVVLRAVTKDGATIETPDGEIVLRLPGR